MKLKKASNAHLWNRCRRKAMGLTQGDVASLIGSYTFYICKYELNEDYETRTRDIHADISKVINREFRKLNKKEKTVVSYMASLYYYKATGDMLLTPAANDFKED